MPKRIAFIDLLFNYPPTGGSWVDVYEVASRLQKKGHEVCLFLPDFTRYTNRGVIKGNLPFPVKHINFSKFSFNRYTVPQRFMQALDEFKPDYVFMGDGYFLKPFLVNYLSKKYKMILRFYAYELICGMNNLFQPQLKKNCAWNIINYPIHCWACVNWNFRTPETSFKILFEHNLNLHRMHFGHEFLSALAFMPDYPNKVKKALSSTYRILVYNKFLEEIIKPYNNNIQITPSGIDIQRFTPKKDFSNNTGTVKILFPGRINDPVKGFIIVQKALRELWKKRQDFELIITTDDPSYLTDPFIKNAGWLTQDKLPDLYQSSDICLVPSYWREAFGITTLEAMATALPVIASAIGGLNHTIEDGVSGLHVPPGDADKLREKIEVLMDNETLRASLGKNARKRVESLYNWDAIIEKYYEPLFK